MLSGVLRLIANRLLLSSPSSKAYQKSGPFPPPELPGFISRTSLSDSGSRRHPMVTFGVATPARSGLPRCVVLPYQRAVPTTPAIRTGAHVRFPSPFDAAFPVTQAG